MTDLSALRARIFPERMRSRLDELGAASAEIRELRRILGETRMLAWAHSIGACTDVVLGSLVPPVPPRGLRELVSEAEAELFLWTGVLDLEVVLQAWESHGDDFSGRAVLDFGCGCGRVLRLLSMAAGIVSVHGVEGRPELASWCGDNLPGVHVAIAPPDGTLRNADGSFDLVYAISVLARMPEEALERTLAELARVLRPGGLMVFTTDVPEVVTRARGLSSAHDLSVERVLPLGMRGWQDVAVLRKGARAG
jgi:SAM-dependent methyltransferase